ncbi:MAG: electron transfer flavoprotein subunit alpha/FixB family protein [Syntrophorhabdales bacterium]|jgi:electron transfer flavoprotein alpha subunit
MEKILIFVELKENAPRKASLELLSEGMKLAETGRFTVEAAVLGQMPPAVVETLRGYVEKLINITDPVLDVYTAEGYALAVAACARETGAKIVLAGATRIGRDFMPRVAVLLDTGIASDVTAARWLDEPMTFVRPIYGGRVLTEVVFRAWPALVTTRPNSFPIVPPGEKRGEYVEEQVGISPGRVRTKVVGTEEKAKGKIDLREADVIVSGGHGMKSAENFRLLEELSRVIGGVVGATRSAVDAKWRDQEDQVGKSGKTVSPKLYIAAGISGAIHHIMGMDTSKVVLAVNKDPHAAIFTYADYGIVGDLFEVVPALTEEFRKKLGT